MYVDICHAVSDTISVLRYRSYRLQPERAVVRAGFEHMATALMTGFWVSVTHWLRKHNRLISPRNLILIKIVYYAFLQIGLIKADCCCVHNRRGHMHFMPFYREIIGSVTNADMY